MNRGTSFELGQTYLIRTVTMYYTGKLKSVSDTDFVLENAAWISDTGRFSDALKTGDLNEVEPYVDDVILNRDVIVDATFWPHPLPREQQ